ncbi:MAG: peptide deformylase [Hyphomicrobiaceae bacterium]|jgi:peptide deformylase
MSIHEVATIGNPILRAQAREIVASEIGSPELRQLVVDMVETMHAMDGIGLAAPQISVPLQLAVIEMSPESERYPDIDSLPLTVFINPRITVLDETEQEFWEGCLSVPNLRGVVPRPRKVRVDFMGLEGQASSLTAEGFVATVLQHELDHLQGVLFLDRMPDITRLATVEDFARFWANDEDSPPVAD